MKKLLFLLCVCFATLAFAQEQIVNIYTVKYGGSGSNIPSIEGGLLVGYAEYGWVVAKSNCVLDTSADPATFTCGSGGSGATIPHNLLSVEHADTTPAAGVNGDILFFNSTWQRLAKGTDGQALTLSSGLPSWQNLPAPPTPPDINTLVTLTKKVGYWISTPGGTTAMTGVGLPAPSVTGTASSPATDYDSKQINLATASGSVVNFNSGWGAGTGIRLRTKGTQSIQYQVVEGAGDSTKYNFTYGMGDTSTVGAQMQQLTCTTSGGTQDTAGLWLCYEKALQANWLLCSGDGANWSCQDTGIAAPVSNTINYLLLDNRDLSNFYAIINGVTTAVKTTNLPGASNQTGSPVLQIRGTAITTALVLRLGILIKTWD